MTALLEAPPIRYTVAEPPPAETEPDPTPMPEPEPEPKPEPVYPMQFETPEGALSAAADVLERYGWRQEDYGNTITGFCSVGALRYVFTGGGYAEPDASLYPLAMDLLARRIFGSDYRSDHLDGITAWNDAGMRLEEDVIRVFRGQ